jgi:CheY-like chemotaxis protein
VRERILLVEDNPDNMKLLRWTVEDGGYDYVCATTAEEAMETLQRMSFELVLMDISLPGMSGKAATRRIRNDAKLKDLPVIAVTAHAILEEESAIWDSGVTDVITKPIDEATLLNAIRRSLSSETSDG